MSQRYRKMQEEVKDSGERAGRHASLQLSTLRGEVMQCNSPTQRTPFNTRGQGELIGRALRGTIATRFIVLNEEMRGGWWRGRS